MITVKIYLKGKRRPYTVTFESQRSLERMYESLQCTDGLVVLGGLTFKTIEFSHSVVTKTTSDKKSAKS